MEWFNHEPDKDGFYWISRVRPNGERNITLGRWEIDLMFGCLTGMAMKLRKDDWFYGPIMPPAFEKV